MLPAAKELQPQKWLMGANTITRRLLNWSMRTRGNEQRWSQMYYSRSCFATALCHIIPNNVTPIMETLGEIFNGIQEVKNSNASFIKHVTTTRIEPTVANVPRREDNLTRTCKIRVQGVPEAASS